MQFDLVGFFLNPLVLLFLTMALGNMFGELQFKKFKFGSTPPPSPRAASILLLPPPSCRGK